ncbi:hypothetical protein MtrunA17_Chr3g0142251 [Medicago truncatula]|uniref:Transmembrane protein, putative n=1 Tax=Medicago truncatula TaxID=3880 RepID=G7J4N7_MEDTR|nr:transmembrane protein, putative [Medicago truncatula]RHN71070.1 hypothetical protein MtrunA17_Chr3g0142251 [Medicago truncatula]
MVKISSKIMVIVMIATILMVVISMPLTLIPSSSTVQHPVSIVRPLRDHLSQGDKFYRAEDDLEDYSSIWKPSPCCGGGGGGSPIPHP